MSVPFQDLLRLHSTIRGDLDAAIAGVIDSSAFIGKPTEFEAQFAAAAGHQHVRGCNSGTDALSLALRAIGVEPGDEVIVPSMTFIATSEAVVHAGAVPVIVDVDPVTLLIDRAAVDAAITDRTRAVMPVHLYGNAVAPHDMRAWKDRGLAVIEDAAQAHLATFDGVGLGEYSDVVCYSFYPGKNLGAFGDAGAIGTNNADIAQTVEILRDHGRESKYVHDRMGYSSRLDAIQAAVLSVKLQHLVAWTDARRTIAAAYDKGLSRVDGVDVVPFGAGSVHHLFVVRVADETTRDATLDHLRSAGIGCGIHYPVPLHEQPSMKQYTTYECHAAGRAARTILSLPMDPLMTPSDVDEVVAAVDSAMR